MFFLVRTSESKKDWANDKIRKFDFHSIIPYENIKSYHTDFKSSKSAGIAFEKLFEHFKDCKIAVSYSSNAIPCREEMIGLLRQVKKNVKVEEIPHKYFFGNHHHKVGNNNNDVKEYLFIGT